MAADPEKPPAQRPPPDARHAAPPRDQRACNNARTYYQLSCGAPGSYRQYSRSCAEAYMLYRQNCP